MHVKKKNLLYNLASLGATHELRITK